MHLESSLDEICLSEPSFWLRDDRDDVFARLRRELPVSRQREPRTVWSDGGRGYWAITRLADIRDVSKRTDTFVVSEGAISTSVPSFSCVLRNSAFRYPPSGRFSQANAM